MEDIKTKKLATTDQPGGHRATVTEETINAHSFEAKHAQELIGKAGKFMAPLNAHYMGSAVVHYYQVDQIDGMDQLFLCQCNVKEITEVVADLGWKQLRSALMKALGRAEPKTRN